MKKIYFRADAGASIGYGHFVRTLALADMLKDDFDCTFFTSTPTEYQVDEMKRVCSFVSLCEESKFEGFLSVLQGDEIVVLDNYFYTSEYQLQIKQRGCKLVCIDDLHDRHYYADVVINHGYATLEQYDAESYTRICIGPTFSLLREPFLKGETVEKRIHGKCVVCFGGSDSNNITEKAVCTLSHQENVKEIVAIVGDAYRHRESLLQYRNVSVLSALTAVEMASQFLSAECVVCSSSSVSYEALSCGCNVFAGYYVDNQMDFYEGLCSRGWIVPLGNLLDTNFAIDILRKASSKFNVGDVRRNFLNLFNSLDFRIVDYVDMTTDESLTVWKVRNLPSIRRCMTNPDAFPFETHQRFVETLKNDKSKLYYAVFKNEEFVGSYDFVNIKDDLSAERGLYINPALHGHGYATILESIMDSYILTRGVKKLLAEVLKSNPSSYYYHLKVGYRLYLEDDKYYYLERNIL